MWSQTREYDHHNIYNRELHLDHLDIFEQSQHDLRNYAMPETSDSQNTNRTRSAEAQQLGFNTFPSRELVARTGMKSHYTGQDKIKDVSTLHVLEIRAITDIYQPVQGYSVGDEVRVQKEGSVILEPDSSKVKDAVLNGKQHRWEYKLVDKITGEEYK